jgi:UDP-glucose:(heptosyl)LPS alpha-1,3-glucosyltransferase
MRLEAQTFDPAHTQHVIVNSNMVREEILQHFGFPSERLHLVRNGIDVKRFKTGQRAITRARLGVQDDQYLLLFVGSGWERKGLKYLLAAVGQFPPASVRLLVVGKGRPPQRPPPNAIFAGPMSQVEDVYAAADLFTFVPIYEPCANVCLEALAAGLPVVTSRQNGAAELIQPKLNGSVLDDPSDTAALVEAIRFWMAQRGRRPAPRDLDLSLERNVAETIAVLELAARERLP